MGFLDDIGDAIGGAVEGAADWVGDAAEDAWDAVEDVADDILDSIADTVSAIADFSEDIAEAVFEAGEWAVEGVADLAAATEQFMERVVDQAASFVVNSLQWVVDRLDDVWDVITEVATGAWDWSTGLLPGWLDNLLDGVAETLVNALGDVASFIWDATWFVLHASQALLGFVIGGLCWLFGIDEPDLPLIRHVIDGTHPKDVVRIGSSTPIVVFSDLHMFIRGSSLNRFQELGKSAGNPNDVLYRAILSFYATNGWTLVENGDIEDLWMRETGPDDLALDVAASIGGPIGNVLGDEITEAQQRQLLGRILSDNILTYAAVQAGFRQQDSMGGGYIRLIGNHDDPMRSGWFLENLRLVYPDIEIAEFLVVESAPPLQAPLVVVAHGHQWDAWNNRTCAKMAGELITPLVSPSADLATSAHTWSESVSGIGTDESPPEGFDNTLTEMHYGPFSAMSGSVDEVDVQESLEDAYYDPPTPYLVLGHTHNARRRPRNEDGDVFAAYLNCGTAGRWEGLAWCVEIVSGYPRLIAWMWDNLWAPTAIKRYELNGTPEGRLMPGGPVTMVPLA